MSTIIGKVQGLEGRVFAKDADGNVVELDHGDEITQGMTVFGDSSNSTSDMITVAMVGTGQVVNLSGSGEQLFDSSLVDEEEVDAALAEETVESANGIVAELEENETTDTDNQEEVTDVTAAGEVNVNGSGDSAGTFDARDGSAIDITAGLRDAHFGATGTPAQAKGKGKGIIPETELTPPPEDIPRTEISTVDVISDTVTKIIEHEETFTNTRMETEEIQDTRDVVQEFTNTRQEEVKFREKT